VADRTPNTQVRKDTKLTRDTKVSTDVAGWTHRTVPHVVEDVEGDGSSVRQEVADRAVAVGPALGADTPVSNGGAFHAGSVGSSGGDGASPDEDGGKHLPAVLVGVLGPVKVTGWAKAPGRRVLVDLLVFLAMHPGTRVSAEQLVVRLWPSGDNGPEPSTQSLRSYMSMLRTAVGAEHLPEALVTGGYQLGPGVSSDWVQFAALIADARKAQGPEGRVLLHRALSLVRGVPFAGANRGTYEWIWEEVWPSTMEAAITDAAHDLCTLAIETNDPAEAAWAARQGLKAVPGAAALQEDLLSAAAATGNPRRLEAVWADLTRSPDNNADLLRPHYERLRRQLVGGKGKV